MDNCPPPQLNRQDAEIAKNTKIMFSLGGLGVLVVYIDYLLRGLVAWWLGG